MRELHPERDLNRRTYYDQEQRDEDATALRPYRLSPDRPNTRRPRQ